MKKCRFLIVFTILAVVPQAKADFWGGDVVVLTQILANALQQLAQLRSIVQSGEDNLSLMKDINRGINDSLSLMRTISPNTDPGIYRDWNQTADSLGKLESIYGTAVDSHDSQVQQNTDQSVAEAVALNNSVYQYTRSIDDIGEQIKIQSHDVSPGGAAKLTAQSLGVMLNLQNQMLRTQATGLKLQAESIALQNRKDKDRTRQMLEGTDALNTALSNQKPQFALPRFE